MIRENLLTEHELVAAVPVFDRNEPRHAGQGDQQTAETVVVQLPVLGEQRHPSAAILPPEVPAVEDDLTLVNDDHGLTLNADFVMLQRVFYQPLGGQLGVTNGMADGTFGVNNTCTRGQSVTFLYRALGTAPSTVNGFTDVAADSFCAGAVWHGQWRTASPTARPLPRSAPPMAAPVHKSSRSCIVPIRASKSL